MILNRFFKGLSVNEDIKDKIQTEIIINNVIGMMSINGGAGASTIVANVAHILSKYNLLNKNKESLTDMVVCVVDFNVMNPVQYQLLGQESPEKGKGLLDVLITGTESMSKNLIRVSNTLSLLSPSIYDDLYEYFDINSINVSDIIDYLKDHYDIVIIDMPNNPPSPLCYQTMKWCNKLFVIWDESITIYQNTKRLMDFFASIKIRNKFTHIIFNKKTRTPLVIERIDELVKKLGLKLLAIIPYAQDIVNDNLNGTLYVEQGIVKKDVKKAFMAISSEIIEIKLSNIAGGGLRNENMDD